MLGLAPASARAQIALELVTVGAPGALGGLERTGAAGGFQYAIEPGMADEPAVCVSFRDALRFANWLHNGQPTGDQDQTTPEDGAYTITPQGVAANDVPRNPGARFAVPTRDEWLEAGHDEQTRRPGIARPRRARSR